MPLTDKEQQIFDLLDYSNFKEALAILKDNQAEDFDINALDEKGVSFLLSAVFAYGGARHDARPYALEFIDTLLSNRSFAHVNTPHTGSKRTPFHQAVLQARDYDLVALFLKHRVDRGIDAVYFNGQLLFEENKRKIDFFQQRWKEDPSNDSALRIASGQESLHVLLKEAAIHYALETDDIEILKGINRVDPEIDWSDELSSGESPMGLVVDKTREIYQWMLEKRLEDPLLQMTLEWIEKDGEAERAKINSEFIKRENKLFHKLFNDLKELRQQPSVEDKQKEDAADYRPGNSRR